MSDYHEFYDIDAVGSTLLWDIWCAHDPLTITEALSYDFSESQIRRHLLYYVSSDLILPVRVEDEIGFVFNPAIEWVIAVGELVRTHTRDELEQELREADAGERMYTELYDFEDSEAYYEESEEADVSEMIDWFVTECKADWVADAIKYYDLFEQLFEDSVWSAYPQVSTEEVERQFVLNSDL